MLAVLLAVAARATSACALSEPPTPDGLLLAESRWVSALQERDVGALACRLAQGFTDTTWRGELVGRATVLTALPRRGPSRLKLDDLTAEVRGDFGLVHGVNAQTSPDGKVTGRVRFTDVFVRAGGRWQALSAQETLIATASSSGGTN
jgi:hypothetical protein